jgi:hypothetical protein
MACTNNIESEKKIDVDVTNIEQSNDSIIFISECSNEHFIAILQQKRNLLNNTFVLTIKSKDGLKKKVHVLNVRPNKSQIDYCTDDYVVIGFPCGGPCYSQIIVFNRENRPIEQYSYVQRVYNNANIIAYIKNEEFEKLIIHNFANGKELEVDISDNILINYGQMDTLYMIKDKLALQYNSKDKKSIKKIVDLKSIKN